MGREHTNYLKIIEISKLAAQTTNDV